MGNENKKEKNQTQKISIEDSLLELRMASKRFEMESKRAEKEKTQQMQKAKQALIKGNEEGAKLYLQNAAQKQKDILSLLKMSHQLDVVQQQIKSNMNSQQLMQQISQFVPVLQMTAQNQPIEQIHSNMQNFEKALDDIMVQNNIIDNIVNKNSSDSNQSIAIDMMLQQLKAENNAQIMNDINLNNNQMIFQEVQIQNQNQNINNQINQQNNYNLQQ